MKIIFKFKMAGFRKLGFIIFGSLFSFIFVSSDTKIQLNFKSNEFLDLQFDQFIENQKSKHKQNNINILNDLNRCSFHFIEYETPLLDYSTVHSRPYIINKYYPPTTRAYP